MKTFSILASALAIAAATVAPAVAMPRDAASLSLLQQPELGRATTFRFDEAGNDLGHYPACVGQLNGTAHHSCGSLSGGPSGGLF